MTGILTCPHLLCLVRFKASSISRHRAAKNFEGRGTGILFDYFIINHYLMNKYEKIVDYENFQIFWKSFEKKFLDR